MPKIINKIFKENDPLTTNVANAIERSNPGSVTAVEQIVSKSSGKPATDFDIVMKKHIIEVTGGNGAGKTSQITGRLAPNAGGKEVILFGPKVGGAVQKDLENKGYKVFRKLDDLINYVNKK